jgi:excisionase family DNA binding protein
MARHQVAPGLFPNIDGTLLDTDGAAQYLGTTVRHVRKLWSERRIAAIHVGRLVRFRCQDLDAYIERNRVEAAR